MLNALRIALLPFSYLYGLIIRTRNSFFDKNWFKEKRINAKVVSIGNISVGGSGKTPATIYVSQLLKDAGFKIGVLSRGYRRETKGFLFVSDGKKIISDVESAGDEIVLTASELKAPAAVSEKRVEGAEKLLRRADIDVLVLDDAFQHRWIHRDVDIVTIDQRFLMKTGKLEQNFLPSGEMREPFSSLDRSDIIVVNRKFSDKKEIPSKLKKYFDGKSVFCARYKNAGIFDVKSQTSFSLEEFSGQKSLIVCGIARPFSFLHSLENNGIDFTNKLIFGDHKNYTNKEIQLIRKKFYETNAYSVLTTQKDAVKLSQFSKELDDIDIYYLKIELVIQNEEKFKKLILDKINKK
ncbi:MAG: tetraacyldisaccharide 4'-kinase [Chlorobi bacterium]|nr:tetraacyldisaccharide 4'-kinase [Chlorobiota bacterium]